MYNFIGTGRGRGYYYQTKCELMEQANLQSNEGYYGVSTVVVNHWTRKNNVFVPNTIQNIIAEHTKILDTFCVTALKALNIASIPIKVSYDEKVIEYNNNSDMKEIFIPLSLQIDTRLNVGVYEINFKIQALTLQGIKFGLVSSYHEMYNNNNSNYCPYDIIGGYIGIFNNTNNSIICWDGFTQNIINNNQWNKTNFKAILEPKDIVTMLIDTKYKLMHLTLNKYVNDVGKTLQYDICCVSFKDFIKKNHFQITPCISLLFYKDCIEVSSISHHILKEHSGQTCTVYNYKNLNYITCLQNVCTIYRNVKMEYRIIMLWSIPILTFCVCVNFLFN